MCHGHKTQKIWWRQTQQWKTTFKAYDINQKIFCNEEYLILHYNASSDTSG